MAGLSCSAAGVQNLMVDSCSYLWVYMYRLVLISPFLSFTIVSRKLISVWEDHVQCCDV